MQIDICYHCDGTGERDFLSGAKCWECNGTGMREILDFDDDEYWDEAYAEMEQEDCERERREYP